CRRAWIKVRCHSLTLAAPVAETAARTIQPRRTFVCPDRSAAGTARHAALERSAGSAATAIGATGANAVTVETASLAARTASASALELAGSALGVVVVKMRRPRTAERDQQYKQWQESQN
ncbi:MAG: hypothetical protein AAF625_19340, partial [Pseudomonadota bacterium]